MTTRQCPICTAFLETHPTLRFPRATEQYLSHARTWEHVTTPGQRLHIRATYKGEPESAPYGISAEMLGAVRRAKR